ncbi:poly(A)-specific ribonuclease PARN-like isoform X2 [Prosopis cineraria]|uniref:poly(A)-specific ribonuclease PARN-like isoform X2 n=1 Tax=Prosopis cineraria TaxID=364024 RepID=UPI00240EF167|nr:poly(A)-specific ribonuclease PARN-like isoform X2 [Prosopis cineraria]
MDLEPAIVSASMSLLLQGRFLCTKVHKKWKVKQVTKSNFQESLRELKTHIPNSDFVAVSMVKTGSFSASWHRVLPFDTAETAYCKAKHSAERFQLLQFAVCPFSIAESNKYNFLLFPRDELKLGMPSYSFSCQTSYLTSMAREGFDFNACIYDGISYLSRVQEFKAKMQIGNYISNLNVNKSSSTSATADIVFVERIKSRIKHWIKCCEKGGKSTSTDDALLTSLRKIVMGSEMFGSRPCLTINVCSDRQVQLILEMLLNVHNVVPMLVPAKGNTTQAICLVLTTSKEDKDLFERERQKLEEEENKKLCGFREVIELISASQKPVLSYNCLDDCTFIHSKFIASLPPEVNEFICSFRSDFPQVIDVYHMVKKFGAMRNVTNITAALLYLKNHFLASVDVEIPDQGFHSATINEDKIDGLDSLRICYLFMKICSILKISPCVSESGNKHLAPELQDFTNIFHPWTTDSKELVDEDISIWANNTRKVNCEHVIFLWGVQFGMTASTLKNLLQESHDILPEEFDVKLVAKDCAIVVFWQPGLSKAFLNAVKSEQISGLLREFVSNGLRVASYDTYRTVCRLGLWEADLSESLDRAVEKSGREFSNIYCHTDNVINFDIL